MRLDKSESLESFFFDGTVDNFRALMKRLQVQRPDGWPASTGERLYWREKEPWDDIPLGVPIMHPSGIIDRTPPTEKTWNVWRAGDVVGHRRERPSARIHAFEERANLTRIIFQDGAPVRDEPTEKIGLAFDDLVQVIIKEISEERDEAKRREDIYVPKTPEDLARWKRAYPILDETRETYRNLAMDGDTKDAIPSTGDYVTALRAKEITKYGERSGKSIERILRAGDAGRLK